MRQTSIVKLLTSMAVVMMASAPMMVMAGVEEAGQIVDGSLLTLHDFVEDESLILTRGNHLAKGTVTINNQGNRVVGLSGDTTCHVDCDTIICNIYLEQKNDAGNWYTYDYWNYSTTNDHGMLVSTTRKVEGQHWYRAKGSHIAILNNAIESTATLTNGIWID